MATETDQINKKDALRRTALFGGLADEGLAELASRASEQSLAKGEMLFAAGEESSGLFVVVTGAVRVFRANGAREQVIYVERGGATIGEADSFDDGPYPACAAAEEDSSVLFIAKQDFQQFLSLHPQVALSGVKLLAHRLRQQAELLESVSLWEVGQRLAQFLLAEARTNGIRDDRRWHMEISLSKQQIAARVGTVREVIFRALKRLEQEGILEIEGRQVTILDEVSLEACERERG